MMEARIAGKRLTWEQLKGKDGEAAEMPQREAPRSWKSGVKIAGARAALSASDIMAPAQVWSKGLRLQR